MEMLTIIFILIVASILVSLKPKKMVKSIMCIFVLTIGLFIFLEGLTVIMFTSPITYATLVTALSTNAFMIFMLMTFGSLLVIGSIYADDRDE